MEFSCAFLNCHSLYEPGACPQRFAGDEPALHAKLRALPGTLRDAVDGDVPDLVGLCEIGSERLGLGLAGTLAPDHYDHTWSGEPRRKKTGLMVLHSRHLFSAGPGRVDGPLGGVDERAKWMAVPLRTVVPPRAPLWFIVNHWQSDRSMAAAANSRFRCWMEVSHFFHSEAATEADAVIIVGDFNCEPGDPPFLDQAGRVLQPTRERGIVLRKSRGSTYLYNPMWRCMGEADPYEDSLADGYRSSRPLGTYCQGGSGGVGWRMVDQMMLSRALLTGPFFRFRERTLRISLPRDGCSDHCAIGAKFRIAQEG